MGICARKFQVTQLVSLGIYRHNHWRAICNITIIFIIGYHHHWHNYLLPVGVESYDPETFTFNLPRFITFTTIVSDNSTDNMTVRRPLVTAMIVIVILAVIVTSKYVFMDLLFMFFFFLDECKCSTFDLL